MNHIKKFLLLLPVLFITACAKPPIVLDPAQVNLKNKEVHLTFYNPMPFRAETTTASMLWGPLFGDYFHYKLGKEIVNASQVQDPAYYISKGIAKELDLKYGTNSIVPEFENASNLKVSGFGDAYTNVPLEEEQLLSMYQEGDFLLDVKTIFWGLNTSGINNVWYSANISLIERSTATVVASSVCSYLSSHVEPGSTPTYSELVEVDDAALLKTYLSNAGKYCVKNFLEKNLGINPVSAVALKQN